MRAGASFTASILKGAPVSREHYEACLAEDTKWLNSVVACGGISYPGYLAETRGKLPEPVSVNLWWTHSDERLNNIRARKHEFEHR